LQTEAEESMRLIDQEDVLYIRLHYQCDEGRPKCTACIKRNCDCRYPDEKRSRTANSNKALIPKSPNADARLTFTTPAILLETGHHTEFDLVLLDHFVHSVTKSFDAEEMANVYTTKAIELAKEKPYLMHAAIAQAACHLNHVHPDEPKYRMAEAFHIQLASRGLRDAVVSINGLKDSDAILTTSMLINGIAFCAAEYRDDKQHPQWGWLRIQIGLTDLLMRTSPFHPESMWRFMFAASNAFEILDPPTNDLGQRLSDFCGVTPESTEETCIYSEPCRWLWPIVTRPPSKDYILLYTRWIGSITNEFIDLMEARDEKALLIFAHWLALMCSIDEWWSVRRTTRECWKICDFLMGRLKGQDLELLEMPAMACGYL
jgi:hypothetical protein